MANEYPCPACGDDEADLYMIEDRPEGFDTAHPAVGCVYACAPCIEAARVTKGAAAFMAPKDITASNHS